MASSSTSCLSSKPGTSIGGLWKENSKHRNTKHVASSDFCTMGGNHYLKFQRTAENFNTHLEWSSAGYPTHAKLITGNNNGSCDCQALFQSPFCGQWPQPHQTLKLREQLQMHRGVEHCGVKWSIVGNNYPSSRRCNCLIKVRNDVDNMASDSSIICHNQS